MRISASRGLVAFTLVMLLSAHALASSGGPPETNSVGESTVVSGCTCHGVGAPVNGAPSTEVVVKIQGVPHSYQVDSSYEFTITLTHASHNAGGFMLSSGGVGIFSWAEGSDIRPFDGSEDSKTATSTSDNISHSKVSVPAEWTFTWTAPSEDVGEVRFYLAGNSVDNQGTGNDEQDAWNTLSFVILPPSDTSAQDDLSTRYYQVGDYESLFVSEPSAEQLEHERQLVIAEGVFETGNLLYFSTLLALIVGGVFQKEILERKRGEGPEWLAKELAYPQGLRRGVIAILAFLYGLNAMAEGEPTYLYGTALFVGFWASYGIYRTVLAATSDPKVKDIV